MDCPMNSETESESDPQYSFISTAEDFRKVLKHLESSPRLAIDIEADSLYHYYEKVCLIQISSDSKTFILDPLKLKGIKHLAPLMADASVEKVFHAASYDFFSLRRDYGFSIRNIFDTHIAAQLLGYEFLGLSALMEDLLSIHHSKRRQRDDWSRRPLKPEQLQYAAMDTHHLLRLRDMLETELKQKKRLSWATEEFEASVTVERPPKEFNPEGYRRIKGSRDLPARQQTILRALYILRDQMARELNVPPFKVLNNPVLIDLAQKPPLDPKEMATRSGISYRVSKKYARKIVETIDQAQRQDPFQTQAPARSNWKAPSRETKVRMGALKRWRKTKSKELNLHVGVVFPANLLEYLAETPPSDLEGLQNLAGMRRWRVQEFGKDIIELLQNNQSKTDSNS
jgi:ribonuclease D